MIRIMNKFMGFVISLTFIVQSTNISYLPLSVKDNHDTLRTMMTVVSAGKANTELLDMLNGDKAKLNGSDIITSITKSSSAGISLELSRAPALLKDMDVDPQMDISSILDDAFKNDDLWEKLLAATAFSNLDKDIISPYIDQMIPVLEDILKYGAPWDKLLATTAFSNLDKDIISPYIDQIITVLEDAFRNGGLWEKLLAATTFSNLDKDIISPYRDQITPVLEDAFKSGKRTEKLLAAAIVSNIDKDIIFPYIDQMTATLEDVLKNGALLDKSLVVIAFSNLNKDIISPYRDQITPVLEDALKNGTKWDKLFATVILLVLSKGEPPFIKINISCTGLNQPYTILAKDITELSQKLSDRVLSPLGISSSVLSETEMEFKATVNGKELIKIADITKEQVFEEAILFVIAAKVFTAIDSSADSKASSKSSSAGIQEPKGSDFKYDSTFPNQIWVPNKKFRSAMNKLSSKELGIDGLKDVAEEMKDMEYDYKSIIQERRGDEEQAKFNLQYAEDTVKAIEGILDYGIRLQEYEGVRKEFTGKTILEEHRRLIPWFLDRDTALGKQIAIAQEIGELKEIEERIGCRPILFTPGKDSIPALLKQNGFSFNAHAIGISTSKNEKYFKEGGIKLIALDNLEKGQYLPLSLLATYSKAMLYLSTINDPKIHGKLKSLAIQLHNLITGSLDGSILINNYLDTGMILLELPEPKVVYEEGELENLQRQEVATLRAA